MTEDELKKLEESRRRHFSFRLNVYFFVVFVLFSVLIVRLAVLQFVENGALSALGSEMQERGDKIVPIRGNIYDSEGRRIAYSISTQSLYFKIPPGFRTKDEEEIRRFASRLAAVFEREGDPRKAMSREDVIAQMDLEFRRNIISTPRRIKSGLTNGEIAYFMENRDAFPGIDIVEESVRYYSDDTMAVQLVGYLKKFNSLQDMDFYRDKRMSPDPTLRYANDEDVGADGLELMYQDVLRGRNGLKTYPVNSEGRITGPVEFTTPEKGADLYLTINRAVQQATESAITGHVDRIRKSRAKSERAPYAKTGYAVAMEVDTGKIVAMASMPDYNPNLWAGGRIDSDNYKNIESFMYNGTIREVYPQYGDERERRRHPSSIVPPGSTLKPLSILIGLNERLFTTTSSYYDSGVFSFGKAGHEVEIKNAFNHAYGRLDPARAIAKSSNPFMAAMVGDRLHGKYRGRKGVDVWDGYMKRFGLGVPTGSGLPGEQKGTVDYYHEAEHASSQSALVRSSFGQQARYTTLQLAQYAAVLATRGDRMKPQFVEKIVAQDGTVLQTCRPVILNHVDMPAVYWREIEAGMSQVSVQGFGGFKYNFRRKTGTSEQQVASRTADNAVFIAYAPADKPKLAVAVVVPDGGFGGRGAAPIARRIFDAYDAEIGLKGVPGKKKHAAPPAAKTVAP